MSYIFRITFHTKPRPLTYEAQGKLVRSAFDNTQHKIPALTAEWGEILSDALDEFLPQVARRAGFVDATWTDPNGRFEFYCKRIARG